MKNYLKKTLILEEKIKTRVKELAETIAKDYTGEPLSVIGLSNGALIFVADLIRGINIPLHLDSLMASSYSGVESTGKIDIVSGMKLPVKNRHVLIVDDILDTGRTITKVIKLVEKGSPLSIKTCVFLDKPSRRVVDYKADYIGFEIEDAFVVGYGLDCNEAFRNLPYIAIVKEEFYK